MLNAVDLSRADLNLLVLFEAVLAEGHIGRAANRLSLTPSAVSHGLGRLRRQLDDPLFTRTPKGVVPTPRALDLAQPIAEILAGVRRVMATAQPFDPATSRRRFVGGGPDGASSVFLPPVLQRLAAEAPGVDIAIRQIMPAAGETAPDRVWRGALEELETGSLDIAVLPTADLPARFETRTLYDEDFVVVLRAGHPAAGALTLDAYCALGHVVVSQTGDPRGFVDDALAAIGRERRIALTLPNSMMALAILQNSDLVCAFPRRLVGRHGARFGVVAQESPVPLPHFSLTAVVRKASLADAGVAWIYGILTQT